MPAEVWYLAYREEYGVLCPFLETDQLDARKAATMVEALQRQFGPHKQFLPKRESDLDDADVLVWGEKCREARGTLTHAPITSFAKRREPASVDQLRTVCQTAYDMLQQMVGRPSKGLIETSDGSRSTARHSADFTSVNWFGTRYVFNKTQAECIKLLWAEWDKGSLTLSEKTIGEEIGTSNDSYRLVHTFRIKSGGKHPAWGSMIRTAEKGIFCLCAPNHS